MVEPRAEMLQTYLVEHYRPGLDAASLARAASAIRDVAAAVERAGARLHYVGTTIVPDDEAFISLFEAASEDDVREAYAGARLSFDRISKVIDEPRQQRRSS
jgi:hypothetical protein